MPTSNKSEIDDKVTKIESFVNEKLRKDLSLALESGDRIYAEISEHLELQNLLEKFSEMNVDGSGTKHDEPIETMVDMGCNFYLKAEIPSIDRLYVDVGLGFHVELTKAEALDAVKERIEILTARADIFRVKANEIRARIKVCLEGLRQLQNLNLETRPDYRDVLS